MSGSRVVLVHHHIFKNAGTSFNYALAQFFGETFSEYDLPDGRVVTLDQLDTFLRNEESISAVSGHHLALPPIQKNSLKTVSSVIVRDPLSRVRSIYKFERKQDAQTDGAVMAKKLDFKEFVKWRLKDSPHVFCNYQTLYCSRTGSTGQKNSPTTEDLELAIQNVQGCFAVGTVARYKEFLMMAQYEASRYFPEIILRNAHLNVTSRAQLNKKENYSKKSLVEELGEDLVAELKEMNALDYQLYESSNRILDSWLQESKHDKAKYFESVGDSLSRRKDWRDARSAFQNALFFSESNSVFKLYYGVAECLEKMGGIDEAIDNYRKVTDIKPDFAWSYFKLGSIFYKQDALLEALEYARKALAVHPYEKSFSMYVLLGDILLGLDKRDEAVEAYLHAEKINANPTQAKSRLGIAHFKNGDQQLSEDCIQEAVESSLDQEKTYMDLADMFLKLKESDMAISLYESVLELSPKNAVCRKKIAEIQLERTTSALL